MSRRAHEKEESREMASFLIFLVFYSSFRFVFPVNLTSKVNSRQFNLFKHGFVQLFKEAYTASTERLHWKYHIQLLFEEWFT